MKRLLTISLVLISALTACSKKDQGESAPATPEPMAAAETGATEAAAPTEAAPAMDAPAPAPAPTNTIVDVAIAAGDFKTLAAALTAAGLVDTLKGEGPFTVFAPTDAAFAKIPKADLDAILADKEKLTAILTYHVVAGKVMAADVTKLKTATTVNGKPFKIAVSKKGVKVGNANVTATDIAADNGVIHVIDTVLLPPSK